LFLWVRSAATGQAKDLKKAGNIQECFNEEEKENQCLPSDALDSSQGLAWHTCALENKS